VHQHGMARGHQTLDEHASLAHLAMQREKLSANFGARRHFVLRPAFCTDRVRELA
jgi:hypothetical protein